MMKDKIQKWYEMGLWSAVMVYQAVEKGIISADDYNNIVEGGTINGSIN